MLQRRTLYALKALLTLAQERETLCSVTHIAQRQQLPAPMLEQILLQLRRTGLVVAHRGRAGGYGLARPAGSICLEEVAGAVGERLQQARPSSNRDHNHEDTATDQVLAMLERRLHRSLAKTLRETTLEELFLDLRSWQAILEDDNALML
ncbi:MAG: Rrf2 family transcriptional regulator [Cyanobacteria bacterium MAG CAR3_bin_5]|nr:Rrf2 family transcriptional regulator [Cyanobacteria bacterium MAG CAR3_bin_5]